MAQHVYRCDPCSGLFRVDAPLSQRPPEHPSCPKCKGTETHKDYHATGAPGGIVRGGTRRGLIDYTHDAKYLSDWHKKVNHTPDRPTIERQRDTVKKLKHLHRTNPKQDGPLRHVGSIPVDEWQTRKIQTGNQQYWHEELAERGAKSVLKEHDCWLGDG